MTRSAALSDITGAVDASLEGMIPVKSKTCATWMFGAILVPAMALSVGCEPEMPAPPPKAFGSSAEEDFDWAMERMKHAMGLFRPARSLGLSVKRELDYEVFPPSEKNDKYTARVTFSNRAVYRADTQSTEAQRRRAEAKKEASNIKLDNPFQIPGEENAVEDAIPLPEVPLAELNNPEIADPRVPTQQLEEKRDYLLEYSGGKWRLTTEELEENEQMWFDYALEQGEFAPGAAAKN
jgi:hypothetical protein